MSGVGDFVALELSVVEWKDVLSCWSIQMMVQLSTAYLYVQGAQPSLRCRLITGQAAMPTHRCQDGDCCWNLRPSVGPKTKTSRLPVLTHQGIGIPTHECSTSNRVLIRTKKSATQQTNQCRRRGVQDLTAGQMDDQCDSEA